MNGKPPAPLEWHPYYRDKTWLLDWLEGHLYDPNVVHVPVTPSMRASWTTDTEPTAPLMREVTLTKSKAWGPAPYVGRPFVYVWPVGTDQYGRHIAGESRIVYRDPEPWRMESDGRA